MPNYRRSRTAGASYFFTVALADRSKDLLTRHIDVLRSAFASERAFAPFHIDAMVVLPEHLHCVWTLPAGDADFSNRWRRIKTRYSKSIPHGESPSSSRLKRGERSVWQRRFWEHQIRDERDLTAHVDYIHFNLVKHGYVDRPVDWPWSSIHRYIRRGQLEAGWVGDAGDIADAGE